MNKTLNEAVMTVLAKKQPVVNEESVELEEGSGALSKAINHSKNVTHGLVKWHSDLEKIRKSGNHERLKKHLMSHPNVSQYTGSDPFNGVDRYSDHRDNLKKAVKKHM